MEKLRIIQYLVDDTEKEMNYLNEYKSIEEKLRSEKNWRELYSLRTPSKQRIKDNLKMIRRLTLDIERNDIFEQ